jgi:hypothetical protein
LPLDSALLQTDDVMESCPAPRWARKWNDESCNDQRRRESDVTRLSFALLASFKRPAYALSRMAHSITHLFGKRRLDRRVSINASKKI